MTSRFVFNPPVNTEPDSDELDGNEMTGEERQKLLDYIQRDFECCQRLEPIMGPDEALIDLSPQKEDKATQTDELYCGKHFSNH